MKSERKNHINPVTRMKNNLFDYVGYYTGDLDDKIILGGVSVLLLAGAITMFYIIPKKRGL